MKKDVSVMCGRCARLLHHTPLWSGHLSLSSVKIIVVHALCVFIYIGNQLRFEDKTPYCLVE
jgi:hypothetical protein